MKLDPQIPLVVLALLATGCTRDDLLTPFYVESVAVTAGDFDDVSAPLNRLVVDHATYEGIISTATWDPSYQWQNVALKVETLFGTDNEMARHSATFVASGTRGLGNREYNGLDPDNMFVSDPAVAQRVRDYVDGGGVLLVTDWGYDLVEAAFPGHIEFLNDDGVFDDAQRGEIGLVSADIVDEELAGALGVDTMAIEFNYSNWAVITGVSDDTRVLISGPATYRLDLQGAELETLEDAPLMVGWQPRGSAGKVLFTSFHIDAQNAALIDDLVQATVGTFQLPEGEGVATR